MDRRLFRSFLTILLFPITIIFAQQRDAGADPLHDQQQVSSDLATFVKSIAGSIHSYCSDDDPRTPCIDGYQRFLLEDYAGAMHELERELSAAIPRNPRESLSFKVLGIAYEIAGLPGDARAAYLRAIALNPIEVEAWGHIKRLAAHTSTQRLKPPPSPVFAAVVALGNPGLWAWRTPPIGVGAYIRYAAEARLEGSVEVAEAYEFFAVYCALFPGRRSVFGASDPVVMLQRIEEIESVFPVQLWDENLQVLRSLYAISAYRSLGDQRHAMSELLRLLRTEGENVEHVADAVSLLNETVGSVSWDVQTGRRLSDDTDDFFDLPVRYLGYGERTALPYGMSNMEEDSVTVADNVTTARWLDPKLAAQQRNLLNDRICDGNFELPVKALLELLEDLFRSSCITLSAEVSELYTSLFVALLSKDPGGISPRTLAAFDVAQMTIRFLENYPQGYSAVPQPERVH